MAEDGIIRFLLSKRKLYYLSLLFLSFIPPVITKGQSAKESDKEVKIGLLVQDAHSLDAIQGAELAIRMANETGGSQVRKFTLLIRSMQGPWGTGSKEAVDLIFNERVYGLIGSHDGRNAHLVEQVCAKSHVNFISARASDPTLSQAFVPWFFNCVPNDIQQSAILIREIYLKEKFDRVAIVSENEYDSNSFVQHFLKEIKTGGFKEPARFTLKNDNQEIQNVVSLIQKKIPQCIVLSCQPGFSKVFLPLLRSKKMNLPVFTTLFSVDEKNTAWDKGNLFLLSSTCNVHPEGRRFQQNFEKIFGEKPTEKGAYAFDATNILIAAILSAGLDREKIKDGIVGINYKGATGNVRFDVKGNRVGNSALIKITNGKPDRILKE